MPTSARVLTVITSMLRSSAISLAKTPSGDEKIHLLKLEGGSETDFLVWKGMSSDKALSLRLLRANSGRSAETLYPSYLTIPSKNGSTGELKQPDRSDDAGCRGEASRQLWLRFSWFCPFSTCRSLLRQPEVGSVIVVVTKVFDHEPFQMAFVQHNHMVEQIAAAVAHEALCNAVLPGAFEGRANRFCAEDLRCLRNFSAESGVAVVNQIARRGIVWKRLCRRASGLRRPLS